MQDWHEGLKFALHAALTRSSDDRSIVAEEAGCASLQGLVVRLQKRQAIHRWCRRIQMYTQHKIVKDRPVGIGDG